MLGTLAWERSSLGDACQSSEMVTLLNSLCFVFKILFLPKYCVKYHDYIVNWYAVGYNVIGVSRWILPKF